MFQSTLEGAAKMYWGDRLEHVMDSVAGDMIYNPASVPHLPFILTEAEVLIARTDPHKQDMVVLLPELEPLMPA